MTGLLDRLEKQGVVRRLRDLPDRRVIRLELTEAGRAKLVEAVRAEAACAAELLGDLSPDHLTRWCSCLPRWTRWKAPPASAAPRHPRAPISETSVCDTAASSDQPGPAPRLARSLRTRLGINVSLK